MRIYFAIIVSLLGFAHINVARAEYEILVTQSFCNDGKFHFEVEALGGVSLPGPVSFCIRLSSDNMTTPNPLKGHIARNEPAGNLTGFILRNILNRYDFALGDLRTQAIRKYVVRAGSCMGSPFFTVEAVRGPSLASPGINLAEGLCQFGESTTIETNLPIAGVFPRAAGKSLHSFASELIADPKTKINFKPQESQRQGSGAIVQTIGI